MPPASNKLKGHIDLGLFVFPYVGYKTSEPLELGTSPAHTRKIIFFFFFQIWILCQNSLARKLTIRIKRFVL